MSNFTTFVRTGAVLCAAGASIAGAYAAPVIQSKTVAARIPLAQELRQTGTAVNYFPDTGTREIGLAGSFVFNGDQPFAFSGTYGVFSSPTLEFGGSLLVAGAKGASTTTSVGAFLDYYFPNNTPGNQFLPYVGAFLGYAHSNDSSFSGGAQVGAKYFLNPNVAVTTEVQYRSIQHGSGNTQLLLGISTFLH